MPKGYGRIMTHVPALPDPDLLRQFGLTQPRRVAQTPVASIWQVVRADGTHAALKIYHQGDIKDEGPGMDLLSALQGEGAARVYAASDTAILLEWLDGRTLGDLTRAGDDVTATRALVQVANALHNARITPPDTLIPLQSNFEALRMARFQRDCPTSVRETIRKSAALAEELLAQQTNIHPLHGDLHHDNIKGSARGFLAFDAKGVLGDRLYDLANAMRNPVGAADVYTNPSVIAQRADIMAAAFQASRTDLLRWAAAHAGLSLAWTYGGKFGLAAAEEVRLIDTLLCAID